MVGAEYLAAVTTSAASLLIATMLETAVGTVAGGVGIVSAAFFRGIDASGFGTEI